MVEWHVLCGIKTTAGCRTHAVEGSIPPTLGSSVPRSPESPSPREEAELARCGDATAGARYCAARLRGRAGLRAGAQCGARSSGRRSVHTTAVYAVLPCCSRAPAPVARLALGTAQGASSVARVWRLERPLPILIVVAAAKPEAACAPPPAGRAAAARRRGVGARLLATVHTSRQGFERQVRRSRWNHHRFQSPPVPCKAPGPVERRSSLDRSWKPTAQKKGEVARS
jgi:hypothetical protein